MTNQQIYNALNDKGFKAVIQGDFVIVHTFKNRQITSTEIINALDIDSEFCQRVDNSVRIYGVDA